jgi:hypothetical protein
LQDIGEHHRAEKQQEGLPDGALGIQIGHQLTGKARSKHNGRRRGMIAVPPQGVTADFMSLRPHPAGSRNTAHA